MSIEYEMCCVCGYSYCKENESERITVAAAAGEVLVSYGLRHGGKAVECFTCLDGVTARILKYDLCLEATTSKWELAEQYSAFLFE